MLRELVNTVGTLRQLAYKLGPYVMLEALLPGGTLLALLLFLYRSRKLNAIGDARGLAVGATHAVSPATPTHWPERTEHAPRAMNDRCQTGRSFGSRESARRYQAHPRCVAVNPVGGPSTAVQPPSTRIAVPVM
jgi:hypothetical protein